MVALGLWQHGTSLWKHMVEEDCLPHGGQEVKRRERKGPRNQYPLHRHHSNNLISSN
jgi:hypothetical protein